MLEALKVGSNYRAARYLPQVKEGRVVSHNPVDVRVDEQLIVGAEDRVIQDRPVQPDLDILHPLKWAEHRDSAPPLGRHRVADTFRLSALEHKRAFRIAEQDAHSYT